MTTPVPTCPQCEACHCPTCQERGQHCTACAKHIGHRCFDNRTWSQCVLCHRELCADCLRYPSGEGFTCESNSCDGKLCGHCLQHYSTYARRIAQVQQEAAAREKALLEEWRQLSLEFP